MIKWLIAIMILLMVITIIILLMIEERAIEIRTYVKSINLSAIQKKNTPKSGSVAQKPMTEVRYATLYMMACNMLDHLSAGTEHAKTQKEWMRFFEEVIK